jgi:hypothetical protein
VQWAIAKVRSIFGFDSVAMLLDIGRNSIGHRKIVRGAWIYRN